MAVITSQNIRVGKEGGTVTVSVGPSFTDNQWKELTFPLSAQVELTIDNEGGFVRITVIEGKYKDTGYVPLSVFTCAILRQSTPYIREELEAQVSVGNDFLGFPDEVRAAAENMIANPSGYPI